MNRKSGDLPSSKRNQPGGGPEEEEMTDIFGLVLCADLPPAMGQIWTHLSI